jgi:hypothetical protein
MPFFAVHSLPQARLCAGEATNYFSASPRARAGTIPLLMNTDDFPPGGPPASLNPEKDPNDWTTGDEAMTGPQRSYLQTLSREAGEEFDENLTKAQASKKIDELRQKTGRGKSEPGKT